MFLKEYISKMKGDENFLSRKSWMNKNALLEHFEEKKIPNHSSEEWKNFRTMYLSQTQWKVSEEKKGELPFEEIKNFKNSIVIKNGFYDETLSTFKEGQGINVFKTEDYMKANPDFRKKIYNHPSKYSERRLSGVTDDKPITLLSLNSILNEGIVIEVEKNRKTNENINLINISYSTNSSLLVNPYLFLLCKEGAKAKLQEVHFTKNCWINSFIETYIEANASLTFSKVITNMNTSIKTSSMNCHIRKNGNLNLKVFNRENSKEDIRIYLKEENASAVISGIILSQQKYESDVLCKVLHKDKKTFSDQNWRLISFDNSKTSINGKICVNKGAKKSDANFTSKSLIFSNKALSFSKPELEILEDDVKCKHGASFGELEKDLIFYMQSRGIKKNHAVIMLIYAFINEIEYTDKDDINLAMQEIDKIVKNLGKNE